MLQEQIYPGTIVKSLLVRSSRTWSCCNRLANQIINRVERCPSKSVQLVMGASWWELLRCRWTQLLAVIALSGSRISLVELQTRALFPNMRTTFSSLLFVSAFALSALSRAIDSSPSGGSPTGIPSSDGLSGSPYSRSRTIEGSSYHKVFISEDYNGPAHAARWVTCWNCPEEAANGNYNLAQGTESKSDLLCM